MKSLTKVNTSPKSVDRKTDRLYLDLVKGVTIFLMLWGHCIQYCTNGEFDFFENYVFKFIYTFHMPLFMLVSGYLLYFSCKKREFLSLIIHRTQSLLQPIIMCNIFIFLTTVSLAQGSLRHIIGRGILGAPWINSFSGLWFLWSVLVSSIVLCIANKATSNKALKVLIVVLGAGFVCMFPNWSSNLIMYPYFLVGFFFAKYKSFLSKQLLALRYAALVVFPLLLVFYSQYDYTFINSFVVKDNLKSTILTNVYALTLGFFGSIFALVVVEIVYKNIFLRKQILAKPVSQLGVKSLQVYCISVSVLSFWLPRLFDRVLSIIGGNIFTTHMWVYNFVFTPLLAAAYAIVIYYIIKVMEKAKLSKLVFGR